MNEVLLRPVTRDDAEPLAEVHAAAWQAAYAEVLPAAALAGFGLDQRRLLWRGLLEQSETLPAVEVAWTALARGEPARPAGFLWHRRIGEPGATFDAEVVALNVHPACWRRGLGRRLMAAVVAKLAEEGADSLFLWVFRDNPGARAFYDSLGGRILEAGEERFGDLSIPTLAYGWKPLSRLTAALAARSD